MADDFFPEIAINHAAAEAIARGLYAVARVDGIHEREEALIGSFWGDVGGSASSLAELRRGASIGAAELGAALSTPELRSLFVKTAILLATADGTVTEAERKIIGELAVGLGMSSGEVTKLEASVKEYLLGHLTSLQNSEAVAAVAKKLGV